MNKKEQKFSQWVSVCGFSMLLIMVSICRPEDIYCTDAHDAPVR